MKEFRLEIRKHIHSDFEIPQRLVYAVRRFTLPFPPVSGLYIQDGDWHERLDEVYWDVNQKTFLSYSMDDSELRAPSHGEMPRRSLAEVIAEYVEDGWMLEGK